MMPKTINMPEVLAGAAEASINEWFTQVGETIEVGQPLAEIETEKAVVEYEAEEAGTVARLLVEPGETVTVGTPMLLLALDGEAVDEVAGAGTDADADADAGRGAPQAPAAQAPAPQAGGSHEDCALSTKSPQNWAVSEGIVTEPRDLRHGSGSDERRFASPLARRLARERGIDLSLVEPTGPGGRIVRRDIDRAHATSSSGSAPTSSSDVEPSPANAFSADATSPVQASGTGSNAAETPASDAAGAIRHPQAVPAPPVVTHPVQRTSPSVDEVADGATAIPLTGMRRAIARRLTESKTQVPHFYIDVECRVDRLLALRAELNETIAGDDRARRVSVNDLIVKAAALALRDVPEAHVLWDGDRLLTFDQVDVAVAVAVDGGLVTPVVRGVDQLSVGAVHQQVRDFAEQAQAGRTAPADLVGGTLAVSNLGMYGTKRFSAILNPPQSAIIAVGAAYRKPLIVDDQIEIGTVIECTFSIDHRAIDGAVAAQLSAAFQRRIESPLSILG
ncbi:dihydrolipoamide acetyltransferase family protein [Pseudoclavibacter sp. 13-3]|uniref:dihydrolipoamide acetyltransferase family protein n=1 Tax=Pseudoclavibacter sp. 13-3 TaxID=2901228 RepID=UPI001E4DD86E|nr:dihydrolipoamide acetyltransferase family protein [Pseudoclavibacter sp. 13-3]MCD7101583.1 2-oxo acid dehydrogenase subunit E2 [Pseudoclavibacter sp. 13-3]